MSSASSSAITRRLSTPTPPKSTICSRGGPICSIGSLILALRRPINNKGARVRLWRSVRHPSGPYVSIPPSQGAVASPISVPACVRCLTGLWTMATPLSIGSRCCPHRQYHSRTLADIRAVVLIQHHLIWTRHALSLSCKRRSSTRRNPCTSNESCRAEMTRSCERALHCPCHLLHVQFLPLRQHRQLIVMGWKSARADNSKAKALRDYRRTRCCVSSVESVEAMSTCAQHLCGFTLSKNYWSCTVLMTVLMPFSWRQLRNLSRLKTQSCPSLARRYQGASQPWHSSYKPGSKARKY
ncbi:hypothetical protein D1007_37611 [Hordeum vulgare]|nr:hypothetical protein D1007_37611 [Hordeum vulgare]